MESQHGVYALQNILGNDGGGPVVQLLRWFKEQPHIAVELLPHICKDPGCAQQHGGVGVMAAGVHDAVGPGAERDLRLLLNGQGVDLRPDEESPTGMGSVISPTSPVGVRRAKGMPMEESSSAMRSVVANSW